MTALVELQRDPERLARALRRPLPQRPSPVTRRGTAFHAWLETQVFGRPQLLDPFELPMEAFEPNEEQRWWWPFTKGGRSSERGWRGS